MSSKRKLEKIESWSSINFDKNKYIIYNDIHEPDESPISIKDPIIPIWVKDPDLIEDID